jgi:hypothetical protein
MLASFQLINPPSSKASPFEPRQHPLLTQAVVLRPGGGGGVMNRHNRGFIETMNSGMVSTEFFQIKKKTPRFFRPKT